MDANQLIDFIRENLNVVGLNKVMAVKLMFGTAIVESDLLYIKQLNDGPARSFWQVEPKTAYDNFVNYLNFPQHIELRNKILGCCFISTAWFSNIGSGSEIDEFNEEMFSEMLEKNMSFALLMARIKYYRVPKPLPKTIRECGHYWKDYYNTHLGAGKFSDFIFKYNKVVDVLGSEL